MAQPRPWPDRGPTSLKRRKRLVFGSWSNRANLAGLPIAYMTQARVQACVCVCVCDDVTAYEVGPVGPEAENKGFLGGPTSGPTSRSPMEVGP